MKLDVWQGEDIIAGFLSFQMLYSPVVNVVFSSLLVPLLVAKKVIGNAC